MVVWTGWGIVAAIFWGAGLLLTQLVVDQIFAAGYYTATAWPKIVGSSVSAPFIWFAGRAMNGAPGSPERAAGAHHTMFWIPFEFWGMIFIPLGVLVALTAK